MGHLGRGRGAVDFSELHCLWMADSDFSMLGAEQRLVQGKKKKKLGVELASDVVSTR